MLRKLIAGIMDGAPFSTALAQDAHNPKLDLLGCQQDCFVASISLAKIAPKADDAVKFIFVPHGQTGPAPTSPRETPSVRDSTTISCLASD